MLPADVKCTDLGTWYVDIVAVEDDDSIGEVKKEKYIYCRCHTTGHSSLAEAAIDTVARQDLSLLQFSDDEIADIRDLLEEHRIDADRLYAEQRNIISMAIAKAEERLSRLTDALVDGILDKASFQERKRAALEELTALRENLARLGQPDARIQEARDNLELANTAHIRYISPDFYERRDLLRKFSSNFSVSGRNIVFTPRSPFAEIINARKLKCCDPSLDAHRKFAERIAAILLEATQNVSEGSP
jgi:site-specific DNA recombinase